MAGQGVERKKEIKARSIIPGKQGWKTVGWVALLCVWVFAAVVVSQLFVGWMMFLILRERFDEPMWTSVYSALAYALALVLAVVVPMRWKMSWSLKVKSAGGEVRKKGAKAVATPTRELLGLKGTPTWTDIGLAPIGYVAGTLLAAGLVWVFSQFAWFDAGEAQNLGYNFYMSGGERAVAFIATVVVAPVVEEVIFRGWLYGKLRTRLSATIAILVVSVLFGLVHLQWNVGVNVFALSVVLCGLREVTGTIWAGILVHMLKNGVAFYLVYVLGA